MGSVSWRKRGHRYLVSWRLDDGSQGGTTVDTPDEARDLAAQKRLEMRRGTWRGRQRGRLSFNAWATEWWQTWAADDPSPTSLASAESRLRLHLRPWFADRPIDKITPADVHVDWLNGRSVVVVLGLVYGYIPYMILPLYAGLDRLPGSVLEAARDLGAGRFDTFRRVTLPLSRPAIVASVLLTCLPMLGDYFTSDLLSGSPSTAMVGNLINNTVLTPGQTGQAGAFVLLVLVVSLVPMLLYVRSTRAEGLDS